MQKHGYQEFHHSGTLRLEWDGRTKPKIEVGCGIEKPVLYPQKSLISRRNAKAS